MMPTTAAIAKTQTTTTMRPSTPKIAASMLPPRGTILLRRVEAAAGGDTAGRWIRLQEALQREHTGPMAKARQDGGG